ncbi:MFS transporter [Palleronia caenipelagi]|uniref:MFS transporter n=1 Tax=Palleronia caenipelagi TaxID=2489174 RepID=A0A547PN36_9RHOB|nr:MFS transporter [Palleronia caenipelagi]TRD15568.1 MFS transporter [Palleronia caenipelagi]
MNPIWLLMSAIGVVGSNSLVLSPIAGDVAGSFAGSGAPDVMTASAAYGAGTALSALLLAPQADLIGLRHALLLALFGLALSLAASAAALVLLVLVLAQGVAGLAAGLALPAIYGLAADLAPKGRESETLGKVLTGWTLSLVGGVSLSSMLADFLHWRAAFAILGIVSLLLVLSLRRADIVERATSGKTKSPLVVLRIAGLPPILFGVACYMAAFYGLYAYLGTHLTETLALSTALAGLAALSYGVGFGVVAPLDRLIDRYGAPRAAPFVFGALLLVYLGLAMVAPLWLAVLVGCFVWGAINHLGLNILVGQLTALSPDQRGSSLGLYSAVTYAAMFLGTLAFKPVFEAYGFATVAVLSGVCISPALFGAIRSARR